LSIDGCTALIRSGKYSGRNLAIAYTNRGSSHDDKRDEDRAIADHDSATRIDPKLDLAFNKFIEYTLRKLSGGSGNSAAFVNRASVRSG
jgi:hypothetical protein